MSEPRNIIGESFKKYVRDQVKIRQEKLGNKDKDTDLLKYISNKTSWIRLSSGVDIDNNKASELGTPNFSGNLLAKKSVLFSARKYQKYTISGSGNWEGEFTYGLGYNTLNPSYGYTPGIGLSGNDINSTDIYDYGMVPPAGIISADIKARNRGSLRDATVQISCHNLAQFKIIEALYLKLKYSILLEWGHTYWYDNNGQLRSDMPEDIHRKFLDGGYDQDSLLKDIEKNREIYCGNYDAFLGWVTNFDWTLRKDGGYDITLNLITLGDVVESLKVNQNYPSSDISQNLSQNIDERPSVIANKNKSTINQILYAIQKELDDQNYLDGFNFGGRSSLSSGEIIRITKKHSRYDLINYNYKDPNEIWNVSNNILTYKEAIKTGFPNLISDSESSTGSNFYYIKLGTLLRIIESFLLKYDTSKNSEGNYKPLFYIDHDYNTNLCLTLPRQISTDPNICLLSNDIVNQNILTETQYVKYVYKKIQIPSPILSLTDPWIYVKSSFIVTANDSDFREDLVLTNTPEDPIATPFSSDIIIYYTQVDNYDVIEDESERNFTSVGSEFRVDGFPFLGKFMHIHVNLSFISDVLKENTNEKGGISVYNFVKRIMEGIQQATGYMNNFDVVYDENTNYYMIRDLNVLPGANDLLNRESEITRFNINTLKNNLGSFVLDASIKSTLNNSFASSIAIGAQVNGNKIGENSTSISKMNVGYTDRLIKTKSSVIDNRNQEENLSKDPSIVYKNNLKIFSDFIKKIDSGQVSPDDISNNKQSIIDIFQYELGYYTEKENIPGVGFIPIDLQLVMDGLSGPRIYETYNINEELLPETYKNNIQFITIGVNHKIDINGWVTTLNSLSGPKNVKSKLTNNFKDSNSNYFIENSSENISFTNEPVNERIYLTNTINGQYYGASRDGGSRKHAGVDLDISGPNAEMISFIGGVVWKIGEDKGGYGKYVDIYNQSFNVIERIAEALNIKVKLGQTINKGQVVAVGESSTGVIHYEIRDKNQYDSNSFGYSTSMNPIDFLKSKNIVSIEPSPYGFNKTKIIFKT